MDMHWGFSKLFFSVFFFKSSSRGRSPRLEEICKRAAGEKKWKIFRHHFEMLDNFSRKNVARRRRENFWRLDWNYGRDFWWCRDLKKIRCFILSIILTRQVKPVEMCDFQPRGWNKALISPPPSISTCASNFKNQNLWPYAECSSYRENSTFWRAVLRILASQGHFNKNGRNFFNLCMYKIVDLLGNFSILARGLT